MKNIYYIVGCQGVVKLGGLVLGSPCWVPLRLMLIISISTSLFLSCSVISQFVFVTLPGRLPLNYYLCMGNPKMVDLDLIPEKLNWQLLAIQIISVFIYIGFNTMKTLYKVKLNKSVATIQEPRSGQPQCINLTLKNQEIADFASNFSSLLILGLIPICLSIVNKISLSNVSEYPNYHILHFFNLIFPQLVNGSICTVYYSRNKPLRSAVTKEFGISCTD